MNSKPARFAQPLFPSSFDLFCIHHSSFRILRPFPLASPKSARKKRRCPTDTAHSIENIEYSHMAMYLTKARTTQLIKLQYVIAVAAATGK
jgi:hypothetical protein